MFARRVFLLSLFFCLAKGYEFKGSYAINEAQEASYARQVNAVTTWKSGRSCKCNERTFMCSCVVDGQKSEQLPSFLLSMSMDQMMDSPKLDMNRALASKYPLDLRSKHKYLGVLQGYEFPFKLVPKREPFDIERIGTEFRLSDFREPNRTVLIHYSNESTIKDLPHYDQVFIVSHGFLSSAFYHQGMRDKLLQLKAFKRPGVVLVDWAKGSTVNIGGHKDCGTFELQCRYDLPTLNTGIVSREVAAILNLLVEHSKVAPENVHLIGFSLGAHISHYAANWFSILQMDIKSLCRVIKVGRVTALDPAAVTFQDKDGSYVSRTDAHFVDIVHTSAVLSNGSLGDFLAGRYGMSYAMGHVDFYVNGGHAQPMCEDEDSSCSHSMGHLLFEKSLEAAVDERKLVSANCDCYEQLASCLNYESAKSQSEGRSLFGMRAVHEEGRGVQFFNWTPKVALQTRMLLDGSFANERSSADSTIRGSDNAEKCTTYKFAPVVKNEQIETYQKKCKKAC